jgi:hypothetical protein
MKVKVFQLIAVTVLIIATGALVFFHGSIAKVIKPISIEREVNSIPIESVSKEVLCIAAPELFSNKEYIIKDKAFNQMPIPPSSQNILTINGNVQDSYFEDENSISIQDINIGATTFTNSNLNSPFYFTTDFVNSNGSNAVNGISFSEIQKGDLKSLSSANCINSGFDFYFAGGSTERNHNLVLLVGNKSSSPASVKIDSYDTSGSLVNDNLNSINIPPLSFQNILINQAAQNNPHTLFHITSTGAPIFPIVQYSIVDGLQPKGTDFIESVDLTTTQYLPGFQVADDLVNNIDLFSPESTTVAIDIINNKTAEVTTTTVNLGANILTIPQLNIGAGEYTLKLVSDTPFASNVVSTKITKTFTDIYTITPETPTSDIDIIAPKGVNSNIRLTNVNDSDNEVFLTYLDTDMNYLEEESVTIGANATISPKQFKDKQVGYIEVHSTSNLPITSYLQITNPTGITHLSPKTNPVTNSVFKITEL